MRNPGLSVSTVVIMVMVMMLATLLLFLGAASDIMISALQEKIDISVYFNEDAPASDIFDIQSKIAAISEVKAVEYVSKEDALLRFKQDHEQDLLVMESLNEVGINPFLDSLNIRANQASQYEQVASFLEQGGFGELINKVDYYERKPVIERVQTISSNITQAGIFIGVVLGLIAVFVAFNAIKLSIHSAKDEIATMRLVGASDRFIRGPFLFQGAVAGVFAALIALLITFGLAVGINSKIVVLSEELGVFRLFLSNFWLLLLLQVVIGAFLGIISSMIAVRKYLKV